MDEKELELCAVCGAELEGGVPGIPEAQAPAEGTSSDAGPGRLCDRCLDAWERDAKSHW
ncbi:hypothetical protein [Alicyclobacillus sp.]|uniref:hypothetical protein n=1 Tax=Alicyclobacillus sp. TaxID=61169 RepID=UPI0025B88520|nr:hypothetical protein [Alicyclobacillus sp.]MCL6516104.1 hypothetical protein [Alicyclobacillus sp.]